MAGRWRRLSRRLAWVVAVGLLGVSARFFAVVVDHWSEIAQRDYAMREVPRMSELSKVPVQHGTWRVAVIGDMRGNDEVFEAELQEISAYGVDATIFLGDMVDDPTGPLFAHFMAEMGESLDAYPHAAPFFFLPGNHEIDKKKGLAPYERWFGRPYHAFRLGNALFVLLDNSSGGLSQPQREWLRQQLATAVRDRLPVYLCMHVPPDNTGFGAGEMPAEDTAFLADAIRTCGQVKLLLVSHLHGYAEGQFAGVPVYVTGGGGAPFDEGFSEYHYLLFQQEGAGGQKVSYHAVADPHGRLSFGGKMIYHLESLPTPFCALVGTVCLLPIVGLGAVWAASRFRQAKQAPDSQKET